LPITLFSSLTAWSIQACNHSSSLWCWFLQLLHLWWLTQVLVALPFHIFAVAVFSGLVYGLGGLTPDTQTFARFACVSSLVYLISVQVRRCMQGKQAASVRSPGV
jgi:hypothetical protein